MRIIIKLKSTESHYHYVTTNNKKTHPELLHSAYLARDEDAGEAEEAT